MWTLLWCKSISYLVWCSSISVADCGSLLTEQSGRPFVESEVDSDSFGLLCVFGVLGPFTFRLEKKPITSS